MTNIKIMYPVVKLHKFLHAGSIFRPLQRGARRMNFEHIHTSSDGKNSIRFRFLHELDISDQNLWFLLVAMCESLSDSRIISPTPAEDRNKILRCKLVLGGDITTMQAIAVDTTSYAVLRELGRTTGSENYRWLKDSLNRLSGVSITQTQHNITQDFNLLSVICGGGHGISFCINPISSKVILGGKGGYVLIRRQERLVLKTQAARALHAVLCGLVDTRSHRTIRVTTLADKIYGDCSGNGARSAITRAVQELNLIPDWTCVVTGRGQHATINVERPR
jgi:hypothetical protein